MNKTDNPISGINQTTPVNKLSEIMFKEKKIEELTFLDFTHTDYTTNSTLFHKRTIDVNSSYNKMVSKHTKSAENTFEEEESFESSKLNQNINPADFSDFINEKREYKDSRNLIEENSTLKRKWDKNFDSEDHSKLSKLDSLENEEISFLDSIQEFNKNKIFGELKDSCAKNNNNEEKLEESTFFEDNITLKRKSDKNSDSKDYSKLSKFDNLENKEISFLDSIKEFGELKDITVCTINNDNEEILEESTCFKSKSIIEVEDDEKVLSIFSIDTNLEKYEETKPIIERDLNNEGGFLSKSELPSFSFESFTDQKSDFLDDINFDTSLDLTCKESSPNCVQKIPEKEGEYNLANLSINDSLPRFSYSKNPNYVDSSNFNDDVLSSSIIQNVEESFDSSRLNKNVNPDDFLDSLENIVVDVSSDMSLKGKSEESLNNDITRKFSKLDIFNSESVEILENVKNKEKTVITEPNITKIVDTESFESVDAENYSFDHDSLKSNQVYNKYSVDFDENCENFQISTLTISKFIGESFFSEGEKSIENIENVDPENSRRNNIDISKISEDTENVEEGVEEKTLSTNQYNESKNCFLNNDFEKSLYYEEVSHDEIADFDTLDKENTFREIEEGIRRNDKTWVHRSTFSNTSQSEECDNSLKNFMNESNRKEVNSICQDKPLQQFNKPLPKEKWLTNNLAVNLNKNENRFTKPENKISKLPETPSCFPSSLKGNQVDLTTPRCQRFDTLPISVRCTTTKPNPSFKTSFPNDCGERIKLFVKDFNTTISIFPTFRDEKIFSLNHPHMSKLFMKHIGNPRLITMNKFVDLQKNMVSDFIENSQKIIAKHRTVIAKCPLCRVQRVCVHQTMIMDLNKELIMDFDNRWNTMIKSFKSDDKIICERGAVKIKHDIQMLKLLLKTVEEKMVNKLKPLIRVRSPSTEQCLLSIPKLKELNDLMEQIRNRGGLYFDKYKRWDAYLKYFINNRLNPLIESSKGNKKMEYLLMGSRVLVDTQVFDNDGIKYMKSSTVCANNVLFPLNKMIEKYYQDLIDENLLHRPLSCANKMFLLWQLPMLLLIGDIHMCSKLNGLNLRWDNSKPFIADAWVWQMEPLIRFNVVINLNPIAKYQFRDFQYQLHFQTKGIDVTKIKSVLEGCKHGLNKLYRMFSELLQQLPQIYEG